MTRHIINKKIAEYSKFKGSIHVGAFLDMVDVFPHDGQQQVIKAYEEKVPATEETKEWAARMGITLTEEYRYNTIVAICGRRWGKSVLAGAIGACELMTPNAHVLICSYTLENTRIIFKQIRELLKKLKIELVVDQNKDLNLELSNGSRLTCASIENVESKLGSAVSLLILDEAKLFSRQLYEQILLPMGADYNIFGRSIIISSPQNNWIEDYFNMGVSKDPKYGKYYSINSPTSLNPTISKEFLRQKKLTTPPDIYECEYEGKFTSAAGLVCKEFSRERNVRTFDHYPHFWNWVQGGNVIVNSIDPGCSHFFAAIWMLYAEEIDTYIVFGSYMLNKKFTEVHANYIKDYEQEHVGRESDIRYIDPAAAQYRMDLSAYDICCNNAIKPLRETVDFFNTLCFQTSEITGESKFIVLEDGEGNDELVRQVSTVQWKEDSDKLTKENNRGGKPFKADTHHLRTDFDLWDALRYGVYSFGQSMGVVVTVLDMEGEPEEFDQFTRDMNSMGYFKC